MAGLVSRACRLTPRLLRHNIEVRLVTLPGGPGVSKMVSEHQPPVRTIVHVSKVERKIQQIERDSEAVAKTYFKHIETGIQQQQRIMEYELTGVLGMVKKIGQCSMTQAMLMIR